MPSSLVDGDNNSYLDFSCNAMIQDEPLYVSSHFADEPLYQFYTANVLERAAQNQGDCSSEDDYEVIQLHLQYFPNLDERTLSVLIISWLKIYWLLRAHVITPKI